MQVNPEYEQYGEIHELNEETEKLFAEMAAEGKIIAKADSKEQLQKLQDDLRKAGYRSVFGK